MSTKPEEIVDELYFEAGARAATNWDLVEGFLRGADPAINVDAERYAHALVETWREGSKEAGFNQPPDSLVELVEILTNESVWGEA